MKTFKDLKVWEKAHKLTLEVYKITKLFPGDEKFGIISQIRRYVVSIPTNLAEGFKRRSKKDFSRFINISEGSLEETKYLLFLAKELKYLDDKKLEEVNQMCNEIGRMLNGLYKKLNP
ncbi:MAG: four helix bundle protein [Candidatus Omnitrophota bacterium]|nr:four helix bundle protein [Candidatus Omnitrophota bacterium]